MNDLSNKVRNVIVKADIAGVVLDDGNVIDLLADNIRASLPDLRAALADAGFAHRFPKAIIAKATGKEGSAMATLGYYVMRNEGGVTMWLSDDEKTWTEHFHGGACFSNAKLADAIAKRQLGDDRTYYVMACMPTETDEEG